MNDRNTSMLKIVMLVAAVCCAAIQGHAQENKSKLDAKWASLVGEWSGEGSGNPGKGAGTSSFQFDLQKQVLVRRSHSEYPAAGGRPATVHDDLMVIYPGTASEPSRAIYFDNEGNVIEYSATWSSGGDSVTFVSKPAANAPQFRLTYKVVDAGTCNIAFEMAPPGHPDAYKPYLSGRLVRSKQASH